MPRTQPALRAVVGRVDAERLHPSPGPVAEALEDLDGGGLAGPVGPEEREDLALFHLEADIAYGHGVAVRLGQALHAHCRHGNRVFPLRSNPKPATSESARRRHDQEAAATSWARGARRPPRLVCHLQDLVEQAPQLAQLRLRQGRERRRGHGEDLVDLGGDGSAGVREHDDLHAPVVGRGLPTGQSPHVEVVDQRRDVGGIAADAPGHVAHGDAVLLGQPHQCLDHPG